MTLLMLNPPIALFDEEDRQAYKKMNVGSNPSNLSIRGQKKNAVYPDFLEEN